ncbi:hypothetical protein MHU86_12094 [Fragilaria crotonensis]|nr:hypothetical protein MHU86_12094 [Fragilaria crotonensis]
MRSSSIVLNEVGMPATGKGKTTKEEGRLLVHIFPSPDEEVSVATTPTSRTSEAECGAAAKIKRSASGGDLDFVQSVVTKPVSSMPTLELLSNAAPHQTNCTTHSSPSLAHWSTSRELAWKTPAFLQAGPTQLPREEPRSLSLDSGKSAQRFNASARHRSRDTPLSKNIAKPLRIRRSRGQHGEKNSAHAQSSILYHSELRFVLRFL